MADDAGTSETALKFMTNNLDVLISNGGNRCHDPRSPPTTLAKSISEFPILLDATQCYLELNGPHFPT